ncbi:MAG: hypothetical protein D6685_15460 [Bacteroidetes bacterium]|nr:MAG: hypothetical protein D6685_15460 [Bacteroidota bacterium]
MLTSTPSDLTPVSVTWTEPPCADPTVGEWFEAIRCPPPGRLNGAFPEKVRYYRPAGGTTNGAVYLVYEDSPRPGCFISIRYHPTETPTTDETLQIGIFSFGAVACNGTDARVCQDDADRPQYLCEICVNVGPGSPQWLQDYCAQHCSPSITAPPSARMGAKRSGIARAASRLWTAAQMAASYAEAKASGRTADERTIALRQLSCFGDPAAGVPACPQLRETPAGRFCGACGCGQRPEARLDPDPTTGLSKLQFGVLRCPLGRPGFTNHDPPTAAQKGR